MTDPKTTPAKSEKLPVDWLEEESFDVTPALRSPTDTRMLSKRSPLVPGELPPPPYSAP